MPASKCTDDQIAEAIPTAHNFSEVAENLQTCRKRVRRVASERDLTCKGGKRLVGDRYDIEKILAKDRPYRLAGLRKHVFEKNLLGYYHCLFCQNDGQWRNNSLILELDHINGDPYNNTLTNLRWLCPNCHSQTDTFRRRVKKGA